MTRQQLMNARYCEGTVSKTFYKGDEFYEVVAWIMEQIETHSVGETGCHVARKYSIAVKRISEDTSDYSKK